MSIYVPEGATVANAEPFSHKYIIFLSMCKTYDPKV